MSWFESVERWFPIFDLPLFRLGNTTVTVATLLTVLIIVVVTLIVARLVGKWLARVASRRSLDAAGSVAVTARMVNYSFLLVGLGIALHTAGIDLTALFAACAVFGVIMGFSMQNIASNFVSGVILLFERSIKPGDILEVDGRFVTIRDLGIRSTIARSLNETIWWALKNAGITIAFPQLDVHFDPEIERSMTALAQA